MNFFQRLKEGLRKTREEFSRHLEALVGFKREIDEEFTEGLEEALILADVGLPTTQYLMEQLGQQIRARGVRTPAEALAYLKEEVASLLGREVSPLNWAPSPPTVILMVGVNGSGKTTSLGKLAFLLAREGKKVVVAAADTFRAAAIDQLEVWAQRSGAAFIRHQPGADPAAVAFDALQAAKSRGWDVVLVDTAGRLQTKVNLMEELKKIKRVLAKEQEGAPHEVLLVLDATTGQNALSQARLFKEAVEVTGIVLTKLDGTAKGGVVVAIARELELPVKFIGLGEGIEDLQPFYPRDFAEALFTDIRPEGGEKQICSS
ncbi:MAG TPA: signal recognition particle-docking protein FtsY [Moorella mulderi]|nr:signal recognition particle-docking protein FtsY [Moorella mulderi]